ncbi:transmembrane protein 154 [Psammomys obesus]|uniref:transmembrane protein 154 n=1 Tax=Psammomys obesus TaxID=48139 RepID=UPI002452BEF4|nr:transmembrane protein 154 [Psammomys obesus]
MVLGGLCFCGVFKITGASIRMDQLAPVQKAACCKAELQRPETSASPQGPASHSAQCLRVKPNSVPEFNLRPWQVLSKINVSTDPKEQETGNVRVGGRPGLGSILSAGEPADMTLLCTALVLALGLALGHSGHGNDEDWEHSGQGVIEGENPDEGTTSASAVATTEVLAENTNSTLTADPPGQLEFLLMVALPLAALVILVSMVLVAVYFKSKRPEREPSSQGSQSALQTCELGGENLKVPIFEEDTPSVMEIEMEELDKWMNSMNRKADYECLPTLKEEKEPNLGLSENES